MPKLLRVLRPALYVLVLVLLGQQLGKRWANRTRPQADLVLQQLAMGTLVELRIRGAAKEEAAHAAVQQAFREIGRMDSLFSTHLPDPVGWSPQVCDTKRRQLLELSLLLQTRCSGAFEPRLGKLVEFWNLEGGRSLPPDSAEVEQLLAEVRTLPLDADSLLYHEDALAWGGIAKGWAVDAALQSLRDSGYKASLVNAGGDMAGGGPGCWTIGVQHPRREGFLNCLSLCDRAVATSGDYERFFEYKGRRYHHLLDPQSGWPAGACTSVSVVADSCALADGLATAFFVLGPLSAVELANKWPGVECEIIDAEGRSWMSAGMDTLILAR